MDRLHPLHERPRPSQKHSPNHGQSEYSGDLWDLPRSYVANAKCKCGHIMTFSDKTTHAVILSRRSAA